MHWECSGSALSADETSLASVNWSPMPIQGRWRSSHLVVIYGLRGTACAGACLDAEEQREHVGETQEEVGNHRESDAPGDRHISALGLLCAQNVRGTVGQLQYSQDG